MLDTRTRFTLEAHTRLPRPKSIRRNDTLLVAGLFVRMAGQTRCLCSRETVTWPGRTPTNPFTAGIADGSLGGFDFSRQNANWDNVAPRNVYNRLATCNTGGGAVASEREDVADYSHADYSHMHRWRNTIYHRPNHGVFTDGHEVLYNLSGSGSPNSGVANGQGNGSACSTVYYHRNTDEEDKTKGHLYDVATAVASGSTLDVPDTEAAVVVYEVPVSLNPGYTNTNVSLQPGRRLAGNRTHNRTLPPYNRATVYMQPAETPAMPGRLPPISVGTLGSALSVFSEPEPMPFTVQASALPGMDLPDTPPVLAPQLSSEYEAVETANAGIVR